MTAKMKFKTHFLIIWFLFILILMSLPMSPYEGETVTYYDKVVHVFLFGIFSFLAAGLLSEIKKAKKSKTSVFSISVISFLAGLLYAGFCEHLQKFIPGRDASLYDFMAGVLGSFLFVLIFYAKNRKK